MLNELRVKVLKTRPSYKVALETLCFIGYDGDFIIFSCGGNKEARLKYFEKLREVNKEN